MRRIALSWRERSQIGRAAVVVADLLPPEADIVRQRDSNRVFIETNRFQPASLKPVGCC